ncbi:MAG TPA: hypothetical protein VK277_07695 [Acidimicrobiales bacterium]|nr:hypothetical protein [Acidimicrobiales bacterium]
MLTAPPTTEGRPPPPVTGPRHARHVDRRWLPSGPFAVRAFPAAATGVAIVGVIVIVLWQLHLNLLLQNSSTTGGDTGAHYMMPAYLATLVTHGHLSGWDPAWYDGYPIYTFYFVLPDLFVAIAHIVHFPYNIAFKWATILGSISLPVVAWACGKLFRLRPPVPAVLAAATLPFLFEYSYEIYGGNLFSTLAGEYAYSLSISLAILFLGLMAFGLRTGRHRGWTAVVLAACIAAHIVPAMFALAGALLLVVFELLPPVVRPGTGSPLRQAEADDELFPLGPSPGRTRWRNVWWGCSTVAIGLLLSGWWLVPFGIRQPYATSMGYNNVAGYPDLLFPHGDLWAVVLAFVAVPVAVVLRSRFGLLVALLGGASVLALVFDPQGSLYNVRFLPLWFLCIYLMAGWLFGTAAAALARAWRRRRQARWVAAVRQAWTAGRRLPARPRMPLWAPAAVAGPILGLLGAMLVVVPPFVVNASDLPVHAGADLVSNWAAWNYSGYEGKPAYPELQAVMHTMARVGAKDGCGRAMWEYEPDLDRFGTPMALMLLPFDTGGCIDSMEGLLFESSGTTPYHFLNQAELSVQPSEPVVGLPYGPQNVALGVQHLQLLGVRYFMASDPKIQAMAAADPSLRLVASTGPWHSLYGAATVTTTWKVYEVLHSPLVQPLTHEPAVMSDVAGRVAWLSPSVAWYGDPSRWDVELAASGPSSWPHVAAGTADPPAVKVPPTKVSSVVSTDNTVSFDVSRTGTPVLVKVSYFPNWHATGADGPYRVTPNLMVVVPTSHHVTLVYGTSTADRLGLLVTLVGVLCLLVPWAVTVVRRRPRARGASVD